MKNNGSATYFVLMATIAIFFQCYLLWSCCYLWGYRSNYSTNKIRERSIITDLCTRVSQSRICNLRIWDYCGLCKPRLRVNISHIFPLHLLLEFPWLTYIPPSHFIKSDSPLWTGFAWESLGAVAPCLMLKTPLFLWRFLWLKSLVVHLGCSEWL